MIQHQSAIEYWEAKFKAQEQRIAELEKDLHMIERHNDQLDTNAEPVAWMNPSQVVHGFIDARTYWLNGFIPLYTTPHHASDVKQTKPYKCMVKDCENHSNQGKFAGDFCMPCYEFITTGKGEYSQVYRNIQTKPLTDEEIIESAKKLGWSGDLRFLVKFARAIEAKVRGEE